MQRRSAWVFWLTLGAAASCSEGPVAPPLPKPRITFVPDGPHAYETYDSMPVLAGRPTTIWVIGRDSTGHSYTAMRVRWSSSSGSFDTTVTDNGGYGMGFVIEGMHNTWRPGLPAGLHTITITSTDDAQNTGTFFARVFAAPLEIHLLGPRTASIIDTTSMQDSVRVTTADGVPVSGVRIDWYDYPAECCSGGGVFSPQSSCGYDCGMTDAHGLAVVTWRPADFRSQPGPYHVAAGLETMGLASESLVVTVSPHPPPWTTLFIASGNNQYGKPGQPLARPLTVLLVDSAAHPISGQSIEWTLAGTAEQQAGASLAASVTVTDQQGRASNQWTVGNFVGGQLVTARLPGATDWAADWVEFHASVLSP